MSETYVLIRIIAESSTTIRRIRRYLNENTRPESEQRIAKEDDINFARLENLESPSDMEAKGNRLHAWFEFIEEDDLWEICKVIQGIDGFVTGYAMFADDEEYRVYYQCQEGKLQVIYRIEDDPELDDKLWELAWDVEAMDLIVERLG